LFSMGYEANSLWSSCGLKNGILPQGRLGNKIGERSLRLEAEASLRDAGTVRGGRPSSECRAIFNDPYGTGGAAGQMQPGIIER
jgi:hypothetical protein